MTQQHIVIASAVVVDVEGENRYLYRGAIVPASTSEADLERLTELHLIAPQDAPEVEELVAASTAPDASWTVKNLRTYASEHGIDLGGATLKEDVLKAIAADKRVVEVPAGGLVVDTPVVGSDLDATVTTGAGELTAEGAVVVTDGSTEEPAEGSTGATGASV